MYDALFHGGERRLGDLALLGQLAPVGFPSHLPLISTLFGDPGGRMKLEQMRFALEPADSPASGMVGRQVIHSFTLTNLDDFQDGAELSIAGNNWPATLSPAKVPSLGPSQSALVQVTVDVPASLTPGKRDTAELIVTSTSNSSVRASATMVTLATENLQPFYLPLVIRNSGRP
jgi:hypothetical protein